MTKKLGKIMIEQDLKGLIKESHKKEQLILDYSKKNACNKCDDCIFKEYFDDDTFMKEIMPKKGEIYSKNQCIEIKDILESDIK